MTSIFMILISGFIDPFVCEERRAIGNYHPVLGEMIRTVSSIELLQIFGSS